MAAEMKNAKTAEKAETLKIGTVKETPKKLDTKKEDPKKLATKKEDLKKLDTKKEDPKKLATTKDQTKALTDKKDEAVKMVEKLAAKAFEEAKKAEEAKKEVEVKAEKPATKRGRKPATEKKTAEKKPATKTTKTTAKTATKTTKTTKTTANTAEKKTTARAKKATAPEAKIVIEFSGKQVLAKDILAMVEAHYKAGHPDDEIKTIEIYVQPENNVAYYVVNGQDLPDCCVEL